MRYLYMYIYLYIYRFKLSYMLNTTYIQDAYTIFWCLLYILDILINYFPIYIPTDIKMPPEEVFGPKNHILNTDGA